VRTSERSTSNPFSFDLSWTAATIAPPCSLFLLTKKASAASAIACSSPYWTFSMTGLRSSSTLDMHLIFAIILLAI